MRYLHSRQMHKDRTYPLGFHEGNIEVFGTHQVNVALSTTIIVETINSRYEVENRWLAQGILRTSQPNLEHFR